MALFLESEVTIVSFSPANATYVKSVDTPVSFLFSDDVVKGTGCVVLKNTFGDIENICANSTNFVLDSRNLTVSSTNKLYYGSSYSVYFVDGPIVDKDGNAVTLAEGVYMFNVNSTCFFICLSVEKDNGPMFLGIGIGMCLMLIFIFVL